MERDTIIRRLAPFTASVIECSEAEAIEFLCSCSPETMKVINKMLMERGKNRKKRDDLNLFMTGLSKELKLDKRRKYHGR